MQLSASKERSLSRGLAAVYACSHLRSESIAVCYLQTAFDLYRAYHASTYLVTSYSTVAQNSLLVEVAFSIAIGDRLVGLFEQFREVLRLLEHFAALALPPLERPSSLGPGLA